MAPKVAPPAASSAPKKQEEAPRHRQKNQEPPKNATKRIWADFEALEAKSDLGMT